MGYASHRAWTTGNALFPIIPTILDTTRTGAALYTVQLGLNLIWMPLFFGLEQPVAAAVDIVALVGVTGWLTYVWSGVDAVAAGLMVPYLGWLGYATYLTVSNTDL